MLSRTFLTVALAVALCSEVRLHAQQWVPLGPNDWNWPSVGKAYNPTLTLDASGLPLVGSRDFGYGGDFRVRRWNGTGWIALGANGFSLTGTLLSEMVLDGLGNPVIAGSDPSNNDHISVRRWNGATWVPIGNDGFSSGEITAVKLAKDGMGRFVVAYIDDSIDRVCVKRWNGNAWATIGVEGFSDQSAYGLELAFDNADNPVVTYQAYPGIHLTRVHRWTGSSWELLPLIDLGIGTVTYKALMIDAAGEPIVLIASSVFGNRATVLNWNGSQWVTLGPPGFSVGNISDPDLALDPQGRPVLLYTDYDEAGTYLRRWDGSEWEVMCEVDPYLSPQHPRMRIDPNGYPVLAFQAWGLGWRTCVQQWNGAVWQVYGERGFSHNGAYYTSLATGPSGEVVVAYSDLGVTNAATVQRWNGASWELIGPAGFSPPNAGCVRVALERDGYPVIAYRDSEQGGRTTVQRWNGAAWELVGIPGFSTQGVRGLGLAIDTNDRPVVASLLATSNYDVNVLQAHRWDGNAWVDLGVVAPIAAERVSLDLFGNGDPVVAYQEGPNGANIVKRWSGNDWETMWSGSIFPAAGDLQSLVVGPDDEVVMAYRDSEDGFVVERWNGYYWESYGSDGLPLAYLEDMCVAIDSSGAPLLGLQESSYANSQATVFHWNGQAWQALGAERFTTSFSDLTGPGWLQVDSGGRAIVAFTNGGMYAKAFTLGSLGSPTAGDFLAVGPNPCIGGDVWISLGGLTTTSSTVETEMTDMSGRQVRAWALPVQDGRLNTRFTLPSDLASGVYVVSVLDGDSRWSARLVVSGE